MNTREKTVAVHSRIPASDAAEISKAAHEQPVSVTVSRMLAFIVREWADKRRSPKKK
jgi:hypothetical protein